MDYRYKILGSDNYDGDSFDLSLDLGFNLTIYRKCRIHGVDTPEIRGGTSRTKAAAYLARSRARDFVTYAMIHGGAEFVSETYTGKFGRPLGDIVRTSDGKSLREWLIENHLGVPYNGEAKRMIAGLHAANLEKLLKSGEIE